MFSPASVSEAAKATAGNIRERLTKLVRRDDIAQQAHYAAKAYLDRAVASEADPAAFRRKFLDFTTPYETGGPSNMPAQYQEFGKVIKRLKDEVTQQLVSRGLLQSWIDNHLGHAWKDPRNPQATPEEIAAKIIGGKKPLAGGEGFRKQRTLPTWEDGFNAGFEPAVRNPIEAELASLHSMYKSIFGHDIFGEEKEAGRAKFVKLGKSAPSGWVQIPDKFANQFARSYEENLPMLVGKWYMPEESARLIDRYLQPGMRGNGVFDAAIGLTNEINKLNLGLSAFHALGTTFNAQMNALELGIRQALVGSRGESIPNIVKGIIPLTAVVSDFIAGTKASKEWYNPGSQGAEMGTILESLEQAGARAHMGGEYQYNAIENFRTAWRQNKDAYTILGTGLRALNEVVSYPIMGLLVPRVKLGAMVNRARFILEQLGPNSTPDQQREALYREWQSIENRMGQVTYDNLFWNRTMRDALHIGIRSVGWNAGDIGEAGGAVADLPASIASLKAGKPISPRIAYMFALPVVAAINGSILHYAMTGQAPQSALDMFYPKTGGTRDDGSDDRLAIPTYMKDFYALGQRAERGPFQWAENTYHAAAGKKSPLISVMGEMLSNKDFFDKPIRNPNDPVTKQAQDEVTHLLKAMEPFSIRQGGISATGLSPAPAYIVRGKEGEVVDDFYDALKRSQEAHTKFTRDAQKGLDVTGYRQEDLNRYHVLRRTEAQMTKLNAALRQAKSPEDKKYIKSLQAQVAQQALGQR